MYDFCIIGGGAVGCAVARELTRYKASVVVAEAALDVGTGASGANSGIVHSGYDPLPGTLMAKYNVRGADMFRTYAAALQVPYKRTGSLTVATTREEAARLPELLARGEKNGVKGLKIVSAEEAHSLEPSLADSVVSALFAPTAAIVDPFDLVFALRENAQANGAEFRLGFAVRAAERDNGITLISESGDRIKAARVINCAGNSGGDVARILGDLIYLRHRAGEYLMFDKLPFVRMPVFGMPSERGKGVLVAPTTDGNFFVGPTSVECSRDGRVMRRESFAELLAAAGKTVKGLPADKRITSFAGVRALSQTGDFVIGPGRTDPNVFHVIGIGSPGLTSVPAIAMSVARRFALEPRKDFSPARRHIRTFADRTNAEKNALIASDKRYGNVVCMCNCVTEAEVVEAIARGARTVDGVKKRVHAGMGRCQGGMCETRIIDILSRELGIPRSSVLKDVPGSNICTEGAL